MDKLLYPPAPPEFQTLFSSNAAGDGGLTPPPALERLALTLGTARSLIRGSYLAELESASPLPPSPALLAESPERNLRFFRITGFNYDRNEDILETLRGMYAALSGRRDLRIFLLLRNRSTGGGDDLSLYMGVACERLESVSSGYGMLKRSAAGHFPGCGVEEYDGAAGAEILREALSAGDGEPLAISAVSARPRGKGGPQGLEAFIEGMSGVPYTLLILGDSMDEEALEALTLEYQNLYTSLSPLRRWTQTLGEGESAGWSDTLNTQITKTLSEVHSLTKTRTDSRTWGETHSHGGEVQDSRQPLEAALSVAGSLMFPGGGMLGRTVGDAILGPRQTETHADQSGGGTTDATAQGDQTGLSTGETTGQAVGTSGGYNRSRSAQLTQENRSAAELLDQLDRELRRLEGCRGQGAFRCAAYLLTSDKSGARVGAQMYRSLLAEGLNEDGGEAVSCVSTWARDEDTARLSAYLLRGRHPRFRLTGAGVLSDVDPAVLTTCAEMPLCFPWPKNPVPGLHVRRCAEFSRTVPVPAETGTAVLELGNIFHLGRKEPYRAYVLRQSITSHLCVFGSPGSGKSNFCYTLLDALGTDCHFLVIEPAKGEYARVFGGREDVRCYGTNPRHGPVLAVNPFAFAPGTGALEHMEALLPVLCSCWPLYAAMQDLLKAAITRIYEDAGWNMEGDGHPFDESDVRFPTFADLLAVLPEIIASSGYARETKDNYTGSLLTRVRSMTNGVNRMMFCGPEIPEAELFGSNVIVDLSRLGGSETQALVMGVLVTRLAEHRRSEGGMNRPLHHVTVLEEAHNLLRGHRAENTGEGSAIGEKSVELLCSAIAEMRSFGEGFLIVDQTPADLAPAVISNTGTKAAFSLSDARDRNIVCASMELSDSQAEEIGHLPPGVCALRGVGWSSPMLMKADYFDPSRFRPHVPQPCVLRDPRYYRGVLLAAVAAVRYGKPGQAASPADGPGSGAVPPDAAGAPLTEAIEALLQSPKAEDRALGEAVRNWLRRGCGDLGPLLAALWSAVEAPRWFHRPEDQAQSWEMKRWSAWDREARRQLHRRAVLDKSGQDSTLELLLQYSGQSAGVFTAWSGKCGRHSRG